VAFHVLTNHIVVVEIKNHKLYKIHIEHNIVIEHKVRKLKFKFIWFSLMQYDNKQKPRIISKKPDGANFFKEIKN
jgi:PP-loop superfamily ATP-utilizing enzyme